MSLALGAVAGPAVGQEPHFYDDDPLWVEPVTQDVARPTPYQPDIDYSYLVNYLGRPGDPVLGQRALNVNTVDEVPDGPFWVNRAGRIPLTPELVVRASNTDDGPAPGIWTVVSGKSAGVTHGFSIHDPRGTHWFLKFDPAGWPGMATGSELVGAKLFWALGFHTPEYHIVAVRPENLVIAAPSDSVHKGVHETPMTRKELDALFAVLHRSADGSYRAIASKAVPGRYMGRIRYDGTRADDPNDIVPHEYHRELRAHLVFAAWLDRVDVKRDQSVVTLVTEGGHSFLRRYLLDWSSSLGSAGTVPRRPWEGYEQFLEPPVTIGKRMLAFGTIVPSWRRLSFYVNPSVGALQDELDHWDPERWQPLITNAAFRHARADDKFWAAYKMAFITEDIVRAVVAAARFEDPVAAEHLVDFIMRRRQRILATYLPAINPVVDPVLSAAGRLSFRNAAVEFAGASPPRAYRAAWSAFDNDRGVAAPIGVTEATGTAVDAPSLPPTRYLKVELRSVGAPVPAWEMPIDLYFRRNSADGWDLVGLVREK
jgi:hypothetical protein